jgi:hypothetical protein
MISAMDACDQDAVKDKKMRWSAEVAGCRSDAHPNVEYLHVPDSYPEGQQTPLPGNRDCLVEFCSRLIARLSDDDLVAMEFFGRFVVSGLLAYATMCSGSESPVLCLFAIRTALMSVGIQIDLLQMFGCEVVPEKIEFIKRMLPGEARHLFRDALGMCFKKSRDLLTNTPAIVVGGFLLLAGFPCTDVSLRNPKAGTEKHRNICETAGRSQTDKP